MDGRIDRLTKLHMIQPCPILFASHDVLDITRNSLSHSSEFFHSVYSQSRACYSHLLQASYMLSSSSMGTPSPLAGFVLSVHAQGRTHLWASTFYPVAFITTFITFHYMDVFSIFQLVQGFSTFLIL